MIQRSSLTTMRCSSTYPSIPQIPPCHTSSLSGETLLRHRPMLKISESEKLLRTPNPHLKTDCSTQPAPQPREPTILLQSKTRQTTPRSNMTLQPQGRERSTFVYRPLNPTSPPFLKIDGNTYAYAYMRRSLAPHYL